MKKTGKGEKKKESVPTILRGGVTKKNQSARGVVTFPAKVEKPRKKISGEPTRNYPS